MDATKLIAYLPFDTSTTADLCGNTWTTSGTPVIEDGALKLDGSSYLKMTEPFEFTGQPFTVSCKFSGTSNTTSGAVALWQMYIGSSNRFHISIDTSGKIHFWKDTDSTVNIISAASVLDGQIHHAECDFDGATWYLFLDGALIGTEAHTCTARDYSLYVGTNYSTNRKFTGTVDEFMIFDGVALHTENFTPPTDSDYTALKIAFGMPLTFNFDLERKVSNAVEVTADLERILRQKWRYENPGNTDTLLIGSWTQYDLPESQSRTGIAFVNTHREKCFDLPATNEVWMKFDVYFDGSHRWRAYNENSYGATGITAQTDGALSFFANNSNVQEPAGICIANKLQTVLLHMVSGSSNGVIEAWVDGTLIYRYTGNVNHGEDFADLYLQSDGGNTFFSNVIISNAPIDFAEGWQIFHYDVDRTVDKTLELDFDLERRVKNVIDFELAADLELKDFLPVTLTADLRRNVIRAVEFAADIELLDVIPTEFTADLELKRPIKIKLYPTETAQYFSGDGVTPVTIPTQKVIPPARDDEASLQSIELVIAEQQITDQVKATGIIPFEIMSVAEGEVLDYVCDMRVERVTQRGILYTCDCCSDVDALLFTQMKYTLPASTTWHKAGEGDSTQEVITYYPPATAHVNKIANALGLQAVIQFDNFLSTVLMDDLGGVTYNDLIRDVFGWSSRVPTMMINVYIRNGKLFVIQRGHEANVIDISDVDKTLPTYTRELVRTTWGSTPWSKTETREQTTRQYVPPDETVKSSDNPDIPDNPDDEEEQWVTSSTKSYGMDWQATTTYHYYKKIKFAKEGSRPDVLAGLLASVEIHKSNEDPDKPDSYTTIVHSYDDERNKTGTDTKVHYSGGKETPPDTRTVNRMSYMKLPNGEKFLSTESVHVYEDGKLVDSTFTAHSPSRLGQTHTIRINDEGGIDGEVVGQDTGDDRVTPFATSKALELAKSFSNSSVSGGNYDETTDTESRTVNGLSLYDSSFPIHDEATLIKITKELRKLNRKTRETVTLSVYGLPHVIDFNDRIVLDGNEYFLVSNRLTITARLYNEQTLTLTRWY